MTDTLSLPQLRFDSAFPALAVGVGVVPVANTAVGAGGAGFWIEMLAGYAPGSPDAQKMRGRLARVCGGVGEYLEQERATLSKLPATWMVRVILRADFADDRSPTKCAAYAALPLSVVARWQALELVGARLARLPAARDGVVVPAVEGFDLSAAARWVGWVDG